VSRRTPLPVAVLLAMALLLTGCNGKSSNNTANPPAQSQTQAGTPTDQASAQASTAPTSGTDCPASNTKNFAKTRFVLHTAEGFGAFHRYLYKPFKAGAFAKGRSGRIKTFLKAGAAALFIKRQVRLASEDVKANPTLCNLIAAPLAKFGDTISGAVSKLKSGDTSGLEQANTDISGIESAAGSHGATIKENANANLNG
jgi:hypothetical protein